MLTDAQVVSCAARGRLPDGASGLPKRQIALLLNEFWTHHGIVTRAGLVRATARTRETLDRVSRLLLRFGISAVISGGDGSCVLDIVGVDDQRRFLGEIGMRAAAAAARELLVDVRARSGASTTPDGRVWGRVREVLDSPARGDALREVAVVLEDAELELMATNDVLWDEIVAIEADGVEDVYDATVLDRHNFIADGIAVHNSIEQDADVVLLLHREDMYERESPRAGEADIILAKHRNGPTDTVTVAFQGHYSRFVDMATG
jgi:replicative DNA helicase